MASSTHLTRRPIREYGKEFPTRSCDPTPKRSVVGNKTIYDAQIIFNIEELNEKIAQLEHDMQELTQAAISRIFTIFINSLGTPDLEVTKPIPVTIEKEGEEDYIASFLDANIGTGGDSIQEAIQNLQSLIVDTFKMHENMTLKLSPAMIVQKQALLETVCRTSQKT